MCDSLPGEFGDRVDSLFQKFRCGMIPPVVVGIHGRFPEPEVRTEIDHHLVSSKRGRGIFRSDAMGQRQEDNPGIAGGHLRRFGFRKDQGTDLQPREPRHHLTHALPLMLPGKDSRHLGRGMPIQECAEFLSRVTAGTNDRDLPERRISLGRGGVHMERA